MEQSANPAARVGHHTWTVSTSTQNASVWSLTAAAPSDSVFRAQCTKLLIYLHLKLTKLSADRVFTDTEFHTAGAATVKAQDTIGSVSVILVQPDISYVKFIQCSLAATLP